MKLLIAEDEPVSRLLLQSYLERWGHEVTAAGDGREAWDLFTQGEFPLVVTDWTMPGLDGPDLIRRIRAHQSATCAYVYIVLLTARSHKEDLVDGMDAGADDFLTKPFDRDELRVRLRAGERIIRLEQTLEEQNRELETRVRERTADLASANAALQAEMVGRQRGAAELAAAQGRLLESELEKKRFYREVIRAVTRDKLHLVEAAEITVEGERILEFSPEAPFGFAAARRELQEAAESAGMDADGARGLVLAMGEAVANAIKHGSQSWCAVYRSSERLTVCVSDRGPGIGPDALPASVLTPGFSSKVSLGMGYTLMLDLVDRIRLATGPRGTLLQLEKWIRPEQHVDDPLLALLERW
jgi:DNA-binding response OmpR family regulator/anti-sigma regulatory factor (Ser/Thr protein kinase)